jgi:heme/copper-type cytochrome/quinol oxidase subunit 2
MTQDSATNNCGMYVFILPPYSLCFVLSPAAQLTCHTWLTWDNYTLRDNSSKIIIMMMMMIIIIIIIIIICVYVQFLGIGRNKQ